MSQVMQQAQPRFKFNWQGIATYKPVAVASTVIIIATLLTYKVNNHSLMAMFMGWYFIVYGVAKLPNLRGFVGMFKGYDTIAQRFSIYGYAYPFIELLLGTLYIVQVGRLTWLVLPINCFVVAFTVINSVNIYRALQNPKAMHCSCLGSSYKLPLSKITLIENLIMLAMAVIMVFNGMSASM